MKRPQVLGTDRSLFRRQKANSSGSADAYESVSQTPRQESMACPDHFDAIQTRGDQRQVAQEPMSHTPFKFVELPMLGRQWY